jgi:hypothetical protein
MKKYWILDREDTPQGFPLAQLFAKIRELACSSGCQLLVRRSEGYGSMVCHWDQLLERADEIVVSPDDLERLSSGTEEWFYNLDVRCVSPTAIVAFGIHDSSAMFVETSPALAEKIVSGFSDVRAA